MVSSFVIMFIMIVLVLNSWQGFKDGYDITEENLQDGKNIFQKLNDLNMLEGISKLTMGLQKLGKLSNPADLVGALALSAAGTLQSLGGILTFPFEIFGAISGYYDNVIPAAITQLIGFLAIITFGFIMLSSKLGHDI